MSEKTLENFDEEIFNLIGLEERRQVEKLEFIASENVVSGRVLQAVGSVLTNKYAEGYPGKRYYGGCEHVDGVEQLAMDRAKALFGAGYVNVQPHSGSQANMGVYLSVLEPGDRILGLDLSHGGHLTHGAKVNFSGTLYEPHFYGVSEETRLLDYDRILDKALEVKPKIIVCGFSAYPRVIDFKAFREIADRVGAYLLADVAHIAGIVAAGRHPSPFPHAHFVTTTTHKTLRGPRGGMIMSSEEFGKKINSKIFPGIQGGPLCHVIAGKAVAFKEASSEAFRNYIDRVLKNAGILASELVSKGYSLSTGGTDNHLMLLDFSEIEITGKEAEIAMDSANITVNKNTVPFETRSPFVTSGVRLGSQAVTSRGLKEDDMRKVADFMDDILKNVRNPDGLKRIQADVKAFSSSFPEFDDDL